MIRMFSALEKPYLSNVRHLCHYQISIKVRFLTLKEHFLFSFPCLLISGRSEASDVPSAINLLMQDTRYYSILFILSMLQFINKTTQFPMFVLTIGKLQLLCPRLSVGAVEAALFTSKS